MIIMKKTLSPMGLVVFVTMCGLFFLNLEEKEAWGGITSAPDEVYTWTPPEFGPPVDHYIVQILVNDVDTLTIDNVPSEQMTVSMVFGNKYLVRVAGVTADGTLGVFSQWSIPFTPELGPPEF